MQHFSPADLVEILTDRTATDIGMTTAPATFKGGILIYQKIDLMSYPSCNDFLGSSHICLPNQVGTIIKYVGRPSRIRESQRFWEYDVYEALVGDFIGQIFCYNLRPLGKVLQD